MLPELRTPTLAMPNRAARSIARSVASMASRWPRPESPSSTVTGPRILNDLHVRIDFEEVALDFFDMQGQMHQPM